MAPSIRARLWLFFAAVFLPGALLSTWLIAQSYRNVRRPMERQLGDTTRAYALALEAELRERISLVRSLTVSSALVTGDFAAFRERTAPLITRPGEWLVIADEQGRILSSSGTEGPLDWMQLPRTPDMERTLARGEAYVSNLIVAERPPRHRFFLAVGVSVDPEHRRLLGFVMTAEALAGSLLKHGLAHPGVLAVTDRENTVVVRSRQSDEFVGRRASTNVQQATQTASQGVIESVTLDGQPSIAAFQVLPAVGWTVIVAGHRAELYEPAKRMLVIVLAVTVGIAGLVLGIALRVSRDAVAIAEQLVVDTQAVARGAEVQPRATGVRESDLVSHALADTSRELAARQAALTQAHDAAVAASRAKDDFLAALSHELRTPLNPVLLLASEAAQDPAHSPAVREIFATIEKNVLQEARLIDDLLDVTRIVAGKLSLQCAPVQLDQLVQEAVERVRPRARAKQIELRLCLAAAGVRIEADSLRLHQILENVLGNAVKFTPQAGVVRVTTRIEPDQQMVAVEVVDTGLGMSPAEVRRIFGRFAQGDHAHRGGHSPYGGLGLGLSIARSLVELHGGQIEAASEGVGRGSTFTVWLPLQRSSAVVTAENRVAAV